ncbi:hypothetical protein [Streptomyces sp. NPDC006997]|uniref:VMAP-C domain-containing protein n=1 Tax=Streptomyces sp. NPDC006997 TaxID=3155356 RepID=UPI003407FC57
MRDDPPTVSGTMTDRTGLRVASEVVDVLLADSVLASHGPALAVELPAYLGQSVAVAVPRQASLRGGLLALARTCMKQPFGLTDLVGGLEFMGAAARTTDAVRRLAEEWQAVTFYPTADWDALRPLLTGCAPAELPRLVSRATEGRLPPGERPTGDTAWQALVHLTTWNAPPSGLPPALAFLLLLVHSPAVRADLGPERHRRLDTCARAWAGQWGVAEEYDRQRHAYGEESAVDRPGPLAQAIVVQIEPDVLDADRYHLTCWAQTDPEQWSPRQLHETVTVRADLESTVSRTLADAKRRVRWQASDVALEFILPMELLNAPVERWHDGDGPQAAPAAEVRLVVVRSLERMRARYLHHAWHQRWDQLARDGNRVLWNTPNGHGRAEHLARLDLALGTDPDLVGCVLSRPPGTDDGLGTAEVRAALDHGLPVLVWDRHDCLRPEFRTAARALLADGRLAELPERVARLRREGRLDRHLVLFWDDPSRLPDAGGPLGMLWSGA